MVDTELASLEVYRKPIFRQLGWKLKISLTISAAGMLLDMPVMFRQSSPVRPAAVGSETAAKTIGVSVPSKTDLADWAVEVAMAMGITRSTPSALQFSRIVLKAVESPLAFLVSMTMS